MVPGVSTLIPVETLCSAEFLRTPSGRGWESPADSDPCLRSSLVCPTYWTSRGEFAWRQSITALVNTLNITVSKDLNTFLLKCCCCWVAKLCLTLCDPIDYSMPGSLSSTIFLNLLKFMSIESVMISIHLTHLLSPFSFCLRSFSASGSFPVRWVFTSGGQSIGASATVLSMNTFTRRHIHNWVSFLLRLFILSES